MRCVIWAMSADPERVGLVVFAKEGVDDLEKSASFCVGATSRRPTSSLEFEISLDVRAMAGVF